jgi:hypothetical protein
VLFPEKREIFLVGVLMSPSLAQLADEGSQELASKSEPKRRSAMVEKQTARRKRSGAYSSFSKKALSARSWILMLFMVICLMRLEAAVFGQAGCFDQCEGSLAQCLQAAHGNQAQEALCQDRYDSCGEACLLP